MLVLSRKQGEQIRIGDNITITIQRLSGNRVSLGIEAPDDVKIMRGELESPPESGTGSTDPTRIPMHDTKPRRPSRITQILTDRKPVH